MICQQGGEPFHAENDNSYNFVPVIDIKAKIQKQEEKKLNNSKVQNTKIQKQQQLQLCPTSD